MLQPLMRRAMPTALHRYSFAVNTWRFTCAKSSPSETAYEHKKIVKKKNYPAVKLRVDIFEDETDEIYLLLDGFVDGHPLLNGDLDAVRGAMLLRPPR